jgi:hypothetical protein
MYNRVKTQVRMLRVIDYIHKFKNLFENYVFSTFIILEDIPMVKHNILHSPISLYYRALHKLQYKLRCFDLAANLSSRTVAFSNTLSPTT